MARRLTAKQWTLLGAISLTTGFVSGVGGLLIGAWYGGNYRSSYEFNGVRGYEAFGQIGLGVGALLGGLIGVAVAMATIRARRK